MHSDFSLLDGPAMGTNSPDVHTVSAACGTTGKAQKDDESRQPVPTGLSDQDREEAIQRAAALVEYLHALSQLHWALCNGEGDYFTHRAAYDMALSDCHKAREIMERLIKGRSPAMVARMEKARGLELPSCANDRGSVA